MMFTETDRVASDWMQLVPLGSQVTHQPFQCRPDVGIITPTVDVLGEGDARRQEDAVGAQLDGLGHVGTGADPARDQQLDLAVHAEILQCGDDRPGFDTTRIQQHLFTLEALAPG